MHCQKKKIQPKQMKLNFDRKPLEDEGKLLKDYKITQDESELFLEVEVLQLRCTRK